MKTILWLLIGPLLFCSVLSRPVAADGKPNIIFILADDLGAHDLGCCGSTFYETPNLDRLARDGARFTQAYAACPVCSPTRAAYVTGKWPVRTGVTDYIGAAQPEKWKRNTKLLPAPYADRLALEETTLAKVLKAAGYATMHAGKWHLGPEGFWPENQGYDVNVGGCSWGNPSGGKKYFSPYGNPRLADGPPGEHLPDRLATECAKFIEANKDRPFFVSFCSYDVHTPLMAREGTRDVRLVQEHAVYAGMVEALDLAVGKVLRKLDELGLREKTIVIFTSDNGGLSTSEGSPTSNLPLRAGKGWLYEGGIREPLIVRWPGVVRAGMVNDTPVCTPDYFPTLIEAAGAKLPANYPGDGPQVELFDLAADEGEKHNLAERDPEKTRELLDKLHAWQKETGARFATPNPGYDPAKPDGRAVPRPVPKKGKVGSAKPATEYAMIEEPVEE